MSRSNQIDDFPSRTKNLAYELITLLEYGLFRVATLFIVLICGSLGRECLDQECLDYECLDQECLN